jgi:hypothetical protein
MASGHIYVEGVYDRVIIKEKQQINGAEFFGWLKFKYRMANFGARIVVGNILEMDDFE